MMDFAQNFLQGMCNIIIEILGMTVHCSVCGGGRLKTDTGYNFAEKV